MLQDDDHRKLAQQLDLLHFQDEAPGMAFWHPRGLVLYRLLEDAARQHCTAHGYAEVKTPQILRRAAWEASGHWQHFYGAMFRIDDDAHEAGVKPVSCPGHIYIANQRPPSYRELPMRLCEFGIVHRDEPGGTLQGLLRLRQFTQDDGHVFCTEEQAAIEVERFCASVAPFYAAFGFDKLSVALSTRPPSRAGNDADWDRAETALADALHRIAMPFRIEAGAGAFYGPKLEFVLEDRQERQWQCATIQFDLVMPQRFDLRYVDADGARKHPVMLHRALFGSLERFLGILLEQHGATLPAWMAPEQVAVLPVAAEHADYAVNVSRTLAVAGLRAHVDARGESLARRIAESHERGVPCVAVVGRNECSAGDVTLRVRNQQQRLALRDAVDELARLCARPTFGN